MPGRIARLSVVLLAVTISAGFALATNADMNAARQRYPRIAGTRLDACSLCHSAGSSLNSYGQAFRNGRHDFAAVEPLDTDGDGYTNVAEINALTLPADRNDLPRSTLYFPVTVSTASHSTGFAITNTGSSAATVVLSVYQSSGQPVASSSSTSGYKILNMAAHSQAANLANELFGNGLDLSSGWVRLTSPQPGVTGFYLNFDNGLSVMDGTNAAASALPSLVLPELKGAVFTLVNPSETQSANVDLLLLDDQGRQQAQSRVPLAANSQQNVSADALFPAAAASGGGYVRVSANPGVVASESFGTPNADASSLSALDAAGGGRELYAPQFAAGGGIYKTRLAIANLENSPTTVTLTLFSDNGGQFGSTASFSLAGNARVVVADPSPFGLPAVPVDLIQGYVKISSSATRVAGYVSFGDPADSGFQTALPFVSQAGSDVLYSQVANDGTWYTGLACVNANGAPADVTISVFNTEGTLAATGNARLEANSRFSRLLTQLVPVVPEMTKGYFTVHSTQPLFSFAVFGTQSLSVLSAIPPQ